MDEMAHVLSNIGRYLSKNITLQGMSPGLTRPYIADGCRLCIVRIAEILSTIHPNYYVGVLLFACVGWFLYIKIRYPFWNTQPVVHTYDVWRRRFTLNAHIIQKLPYKLQFYDREKQITTFDYSRVETPDKSQIAVFLQSNYIPSDRLLSTISVPVLDVYLTGHEYPSFVSVHREGSLTVGSLTVGSLTAGSLTGVIASRLINLYIGLAPTFSYEYPITTLRRLDGRLTSKPGNFRSVGAPLPAYFIDFMCVGRQVSGRQVSGRQVSGRQVSERLFHTHEYNRRIRTPDVPVSFFRKEGALCEGVVPWISYTTYTFLIPPSVGRSRVPSLPPRFVVSRIEKKHTGWVRDIYALLESRQLFSVAVLPALGNVLALLESREWEGYCLRKGEQLYGVYFFRNAHVHYEDVDGDTLELMAAVHAKSKFSVLQSEAADKHSKCGDGRLVGKYNVDLFVAGFRHAFKEATTRVEYKILRIPSLGHNLAILAKMRGGLVETPGALYLYNYVVPNMPVDNTDCVVLV